MAINRNGKQQQLVRAFLARNPSRNRRTNLPTKDVLPAQRGGVAPKAKIGSYRPQRKIGRY